MEVKLESLIEKIRQDGIQEAKRAAAEILQKAEKEAQGIIKKAKQEAEEIITQAQEESQKLKTNTENSLKQAARDLKLSLKSEISNLFNRLIKQKISQKLEPDFMKQLIVKIVENWSTEKDSDLEVLVNKDDQKKLQELLSEELKQKAKGMIEVKISRNIDKGFGIGIKGGELYYDFSAESIAEALKEFLNPSIAAMLDANNG